MGERREFVRLAPDDGVNRRDCAGGSGSARISAINGLRGGKPATGSYRIAHGVRV